MIDAMIHIVAKQKIKEKLKMKRNFFACEKIKKASVCDLVRLVVLCIIFMCFLSIASLFISSVVVYFNINCFILNWGYFFNTSLMQAVAGGAVFGIGLWIKDKLLERQEQKDKDQKGP